jgi:hypothetical protein
MFTSKRKELNARQAKQKASDANMDYFYVRHAIKTGDKQALEMLADYERRYSAWLGNIAALRSYLADNN